jgi:hypothetical protein
MKGLVIDRIQRMQTGDPVLRVRRCRVSYGILASVPFDPEAHEEEEHYTNPFTGQKLALNIIKWIIKKVFALRDSGSHYKKMRTEKIRVTRFVRNRRLI